MIYKKRTINQYFRIQRFKNKVINPLIYVQKNNMCWYKSMLITLIFREKR